MMTYDMEKLILTDADGVLLNWEYSFNIWMKSKGYKLVPNADLTAYNVQDRYDLTKDEKRKLVNEFNNSAAIGFLPPLRDAIEYVTKLHREHGYVFHCITSLSTDKSAQRLRTMNLEKLFGNVFDEYIYLATGADKDEALLPYKDSGLFWIEDKLENAIAGEKVGLDPLLIEHGHNMIRSNVYSDAVAVAEAHHIPRFSSWKGVYNHIVGV